MKRIQFLYDDVEHAMPLLRAQESLLCKDIRLEATETHSAESAIRLVNRQADLLLIHQTLMSDDALDHGIPVVINERIDGAQLAASRPWLPEIDRNGQPRPSVCAVIKGYVYRTRRLYNAHRGRLHAHQLKAAGLFASTPDCSVAIDGLPSPQLSSDEFGKIHISYGFGAYAKMDIPRAQIMDFDAPRKTDVTFVGWTDYKGSEIETHRKAAVQNITLWSKEHPGRAVVGEGRPLRGEAYYRNMLTAKCVVSPYGWGEAAHRDYEAMLLGAVVIKPPMKHIDCYPNVYIPNETYIPCRLDFADVPTIVDRVVAEWPEWRDRRQKTRELALQASNPRRTAQRIATLLGPYL